MNKDSYIMQLFKTFLHLSFSLSCCQKITIGAYNESDIA